ncbi:MAG TPA: 3-deoxy-8-phosphooctulonate synthase [Gemmatimonadales bacterium]
MTAWQFGPGPFLIAGPCVIEDDDTMLRIADELVQLAERHDIRVCFKASFDKANRARGESPRGPGLAAGLEALARVRQRSGLSVLTDVHEAAQAMAVADVADALQIPAFLCRQTDLLIAAGQTGKPVNIKKGQWVHAGAMAGAVGKVRTGGSGDIAVTERGTFFGYGDLVVDFRNFARLHEATGCAVIYDATHSVQQPGQAPGGASGGLREHIPALLAAAAAAGADGFFIETHPEPDRALSDAATQWPLDRLDALVEQTLAVWHTAHEHAGV